ncbi:hypothetical protein GCM10011387_19140 [Pedobacter quisquiliarum]|uniref:Homeodomain-like domain-containing protein n=1 Tax=Pedobacter quisquiliarum TaxID=1834438 RepID=A0A916XDJ9_9SPHI|nr:hypothetical protein [Pedobacter quisquiliarum]GGC65714.1 hypothetical protein GCM10011387_19140 [Pedobacter quisquiliarum]
MHKIRQILLFLERGVSQRAIEKEVKITRKTIAIYLGKFLQTGISFSELLKQSDQQLEQLLGLLKTIVPGAARNGCPFLFTDMWFINDLLFPSFSRLLSR